jgi:fatty acid desaturase
LLRHLFLLISGGQVLYTHFGPASADDGGRAQRLLAAVPRIARVAGAQLVLLGLFALAGSWTTYFTLWLLPLTTLTVILNGLRAFCDHATVADEEDDERLATYASTPVERFFLAPFHMNFHAEHHLFPYVPHYRLPVLRAHLSTADEYRAVIRWRAGYFGFVRQFLRSQRRTTASV